MVSHIHMTAMHVVSNRTCSFAVPCKAKCWQVVGLSPNPSGLGCLLGMPIDGNGFLAPGAGIGDEAFRRQQRRSEHSDQGSRKLPGITSAKLLQLCIISHENEADGTDVCERTGRAQHVQELPGKGMRNECRPGNLCLLYPASRNRKIPAT